MEYTLVTGGLGYIGSHVVLDLINSERNVIIIDNLSNSNIQVLNNLKKISNKEILFFNFDITECDHIKQIFQKYNIDSVIHFAALKSIPDSINNPKLYFHNNVNGLKNIFDLSQTFGIKRFIFSSTAAIYDKTNKFPVNEKGSISFLNPYAQTKIQCEKYLRENQLNKDISVCILRYFNPAANHSSGLIGDFITPKSTNLFPMILKSIMTKKKIEIFGQDYETNDGTPIRDFIHVSDLSMAHISSMEYIQKKGGLYTYNVGTGIGFTVKEIIDTFSKINSINLDYKLGDRRKGDIGISYADNSKIKNEIGWSAVKTIEEVCLDVYKFFKKNYL